MAGRFFHLLALFHAVCVVVRTTHCSAFAKPSSVVRLDDGNRLARKLQGLVDGRVVTQQGSPDSFDEACKGWMAAGYSQDYHSRPALVLQPAGVKDVQAAVRFVKMEKLSLAVKGGGHSWRTLFLADGGLTIDLSSMKGILVDSDSQTATVQGGVTYDDVIAETSKYNLAASWGSCGGVGTGTPLGGGIGLLSRAHGIGADNILEAQLVIANGSLVIANATHNQEILEVVRGAGATLGVVVQLKVQLYDVSSFHGFALTALDLSGSNLKKLIAWTRKVAQLQPQAGIEIVQQLTDAGQPEVTVWAALPATAAACQADLDAFLSPLHDVTNITEVKPGPLSVPDMVATINAETDMIPYSSNYQAVFHLSLEQASDEFLDYMTKTALEGLPQDVVSPIVYWDFIGNGAAPNAINATPSFTPFAGKVDLQYFFAYFWPPGQDNEAHMAFGESIRLKLNKYALNSQAYVNQATFVSDEWLTSQVGGPANLAKLRAIKQQVDPGNVFRHHAYVGLWQQPELLNIEASAL